MTDRIEEFSIEGKNFIYYDLSNFQTLDQFDALIEEAKLGIVKYPKRSLLTISNIANFKFDTRVKDALIKWVAFNKPFVKCGAVTGVNGIKKILLNAIFAASGRSNIKFIHTKAQAIEWLLKQ
jgi:hypothetical protein